jgi:aminopeptidase-like protein
VKTTNLVQNTAGTSDLSDAIRGLDIEDVGQWMHALIEELYPLCRSITGNGFRQTLAAIQQRIPLTVNEVPTGTQVFDWTVPKEWNIRDAYVKDAEGRRVMDFKQSNLHVVNYSVPVKKKMSLAELRKHLSTLPDFPDWIPYRTSYYKETWGFCLSERQLEQLKDTTYEVCIDATLEPGSLTYGEYCIQGETPGEVLFSCHGCHPSLCNDNLSGLALVTALAEALSGKTLRYSYRFLFIPGTIGSIAWLSRNEDTIPKIKHGLVVACVGDPGNLVYKKSRRGDAEIDRAVMHVLAHLGQEHEILEFSPYGYDERQYCSPAFNLPVGSLTRTPHGRFPQYHTSADDLDFVQPASLGDSLSTYLAVVSVLEHNRSYMNLNPTCEPQLGRRGLYEGMSGQTDQRAREMAMLWVLSLSDGEHSLLEIAERAGMTFDAIKEAADRLRAHDLLEEVTG